MIYGNITDLFKKDDMNYELKKNSNNIFYVYITIILSFFIIQFQTLIIQYLSLIVLFFFFSIKTGIIFASLFFLLLNYKKIITNAFLKYIMFVNICSNLLFLIFSTMIESYSETGMYITSMFFNLIAILSNIYIIFIISKTPCTNTSTQQNEPIFLNNSFKKKTSSDLTNHNEPIQENFVPNNILLTKENISTKAGINVFLDLNYQE